MRLLIDYTFTQPQQQIEFAITIDGDKILSQRLDGQRHQFRYDFDDSDEFRPVEVLAAMSGKTQQHTVIDESGQIVADSAIMIDRIMIDGIDVTEIFCQGRTCYHHDGNGTCARFLDEFYGYMGCNGEVCIEYSLPLYEWFLKNCQ